MDDTRQLAWVESPLQLVAAAEYAAARGRAVDVAMRLGPQMSETARVLLDRRAYFSSCVPYVGIPWGLLTSRRSWVIGDGFSGQFLLAMSTLGARRVTLLDDGIMTIHLARAVAGAREFHRPGHAPSGRRRLLADLSRDRLLGLAARSSAGFFTAFADHDALADARAQGFTVETNSFAWLRSEGRPADLPSDRVVLGSAAVTDRTLTPARYLAWVAAVVGESDRTVTYLPHRRETPALLEAVAALPGVRLVRTGIPVELALAGTTRALDISTLPSTAAVTLGAVLAGSGSTIRTHDLRERVA